MNVPIIITAFGTTTRAHRTYDFFDNILKQEFPGHEIIWAYSSRMVRDFVKKRKNHDLPGPVQILEDIKQKGHEWAVVQSFHLIAGHEFYRLTQEVRLSDLRTSIGLPLLHNMNDYNNVIKKMTPTISRPEDEAVIIVGHGTDHPSWSSYLALNHLLKQRLGPNIYVCVIEGQPAKEAIIDSIIESGIKKAHLVPFMLVAGTHFEEDLIGEEDSFKNIFEAKGISVTAETKGIGMNRGIMEIFIQHIKDALDAIPKSR